MRMELAYSSGAILLKEDKRARLRHLSRAACQYAVSAPLAEARPTMAWPKFTLLLLRIARRLDIYTCRQGNTAFCAAP